MESILRPFVPHHNPPSVIAWFLSCVAYYDLQPHCPLSLLISCQSLHVIHALYALTREVVHSPPHPFHSAIIISVSLSVALLFSLVP